MPNKVLDFQGKTAVEIRVYMSTLGWMSEDQLSDVGWENKVGYCIWFKRRD
ncbi:MAG: hypothetical protein AB1700_04130 [Bacillota bacterium]|jgi:hypothetical protein